MSSSECDDESSLGISLRKRPLRDASEKESGDKPPHNTLTVEGRPGGTVVTVRHANGTDFVYIASRGERHAVTLSGRKLQGQVAVVRTNRKGDVIAADTN